MRTYNMKLNTAKCAFGVRARKFLGFMVTQSGIEVNPDQIRAVLETLALRDKEQIPVYYMSKAMVDAETRYSRMEQTTLALKNTAQKLRPYF
ncbi:hypothetical protein CK203_110254 [Vitis vinifera]|uniref:Reverse transcriptase RNase H-like domain-containing protein n=1 Tax=Vitis vinifera TaxID=29760 RepID=A0A438CFK8_VITVI|nr:hypothetical protein CK203_110254 [Vitis vinifera]